MAVRLSAVAFKHAKELVALGHYIYDDRDAWSEHRPTAQQENEFIRQHGFEEYRSGIRASATKSRSTLREDMNFLTATSRMFIAVDVLSAESRAGQYKHFDIEKRHINYT